MMLEYMFHGVLPPSVQCSEAWKLPNGMMSLNQVSWTTPSTGASTPSALAPSEMIPSASR